MSHDRRVALRVPESRLITEIVSEEPFAASAVNLSTTGLYTVKPFSSGPRGPRIIQVEIPVPEANESVWAKGEIVFESVSARSMGTGIRLLAMAKRDMGLIADVVEMRRREILGRMLREIKWRKELAAYPSPFTAPPPPVTEDTVRMYLAPGTGLY
jgi:hypothetical protein